MCVTHENLQQSWQFVVGRDCVTLWLIWNILNIYPEMLAPMWMSLSVSQSLLFPRKQTLILMLHLDYY